MFTGNYVKDLLTYIIVTDWVAQFLQVLHQNTGNGTYIYIKVKTQFHKIGT